MALTWIESINLTFYLTLFYCTVTIEHMGLFLLGVAKVTHRVYGLFLLAIVTCVWVISTGNG